MSDWTLEALDEFATTSGLKVDRGVRARHIASSDWGGIVFGRPAAVVRPHSADDVAAAVGYASTYGLSLTPRATGASSGGQAVGDRTLVVDLTGMDDVAVDAEARTLTCGPGASWRSILHAALPHGLQPHVMPLQLDLTVGGTLSVGGFGAIGHRFGIAATHAAELEVVTGDGRIVRCDADAERELFDAVRAGLGRCGVITSATLALRPAARGVLVSRKRSSSVNAWISDLLAIAEASAEQGVVHVEGFCRSEAGALACDLHLGTERDGAGLELTSWDDAAEPLGEEEISLPGYHGRLDPRFEEMVAVGYTDRGHPWVEALLSPEAFAELLPDIMRGVAGDAGDRIQVVLVRRDALPPFVVAPDVPLLICVVIVPRGIPREQLPGAIEAMTAVNALLTNAGGKRYLAGWLPDTDEQAWRRHFGDLYDAWQGARAKYDPRGTFTSALFTPLDRPSP